LGSTYQQELPALGKLQAFDNKRVRYLARLHDVRGGGFDNRYDAPRARHERVLALD
jgi:hypothetical protein